MLILLYVDDIIITGSSQVPMQRLKIITYEEFHMKELWQLSYFMGIEIDRHREHINMSQWKYTTNLLKKANMVDCKPASTPMASNKELYNTEFSRIMDKPDLHRMIVGSLQYLTLTRPDLCCQPSIRIRLDWQRNLRLRYFSLGAMKRESFEPRRFLQTRFISIRQLCTCRS